MNSQFINKNSLIAKQSSITTNKDQQEFWACAINQICQVCKKEPGKYRCPKCGTIYCCSNCFKNHSAFCINKFSERTLSSLPPPTVSLESKLRMQKIILQNEKQQQRYLEKKNLQKEIDSNNMNVKSKIHESKNNNHFDSDQDLNKILADDSENDFENIPVDPIEPWKAWWEKAVIINAPVPTDPPPNGSPLLRYHLVDILYSYCYVIRLYNGDISWDFDGASEAFTFISTVLDTKDHVISVKNGIEQCIIKTRRPDLFIEFQWQVEVVHDVELCLQTHSHVFRALSEIQAALANSKQKYKSAIMKAKFVAAWTQSLTQKDLEKLSKEVHEYYTSLQSLLYTVYCNEVKSL